MSGQYEPVGRKRDVAATRLTNSAAAQQLFAERDHERATVREIAARAGVDQALGRTEHTTASRATVQG